MSGYRPAPSSSNGRIFASYPLPAKIDLLNERPRRESLVDRELENKIGSLVTPEIQITAQGQYLESNSTNYQQARPSSQPSEQNQWNAINNDQRANYQQQYQIGPTSRPASRASSTRSTSVVADLLEKEAKLMHDIEELERKPYNPQTMLVEREQWYEYPDGRPQDRHLTESRRRVTDFCTLPPNMYPEGGSRHIHEENLPAPSTLSRQSAPSPGSIHTTIIRSPKREIDNRSPLPIAFDNFSTKGVRGNIASIGATEPDRPRAPIYPIVRRTPSPSV